MTVTMPARQARDGFGIIGAMSGSAACGLSRVSEPRPGAGDGSLGHDILPHPGLRCGGNDSVRGGGGYTPFFRLPGAAAHR